MKKVNDFGLIAEAYGNIHPAPEQVAVIEVDPASETSGGCPSCGSDRPDRDRGCRAGRRPADRRRRPVRA